MSLSTENELIIRKAIADRLNTISDIGYVLPAPVYFAEKSDFFSQISNLNLTTREGIEEKTVKFCAFYPLQFTESEAINLIYEIYLFVESNLERKDETPAPDEFLKQLLKSHSEFIAAWLGIRKEFEDSQTLSGLTEFSLKKTAPIAQDEFIRNNELCEYIPNLRGYAVKMQLSVNLLEKNSC